MINFPKKSYLQIFPVEEVVRMSGLLLYQLIDPEALNIRLPIQPIAMYSYLWAYLLYTIYCGLEQTKNLLARNCFLSHNLVLYNNYVAHL